MGDFPNRPANMELPPVAGVKRPAPSTLSLPSLLPAFEPFSSSPGFPRPAKRQARESPSDREGLNKLGKYPTPAPTSSTGFLSSSPPPPLPRTARPGLQRTQSNMSERAPLSTVPSITLPEDGEPILMGRSSNSTHHQLSSNRFISRVHVRAAYIPAATSLAPNKVEVVCLGWNGIKIHCQGRAWDLGKGDTFTSEAEHDIMLDAQNSRVLITWPVRERKGSGASTRSDSSWDEENSPTKVITADGRVLESSPVRLPLARETPSSPTPRGMSSARDGLSLLSPQPSSPSGPEPVVVYEDDASEGELAVSYTETQTTYQATQPSQAKLEESSGQVSGVPNEAEEFSDRDEENEPIIASFGPAGHNLLPRMASITAGASPRVSSPRASVAPLMESVSPRQPQQKRSTSESTNEAENTVLANHIINQLAFSRLSSTPLSTIMSHLPAELKGDSRGHKENRPLSDADLKAVLESTVCIGVVDRQGKDAAGKVLESEYYYIPDLDVDEKRRDAVVDGLRKPGLRNCRKQHKVSEPCAELETTFTC